MIERLEGEGMTEFTMRRIRAEIIEDCAKCVPTNWCDSLLTGRDAPKPPLDNRAVEQLLRGIQDRIRALKAPVSLQHPRGES
jgi:hypothetical protein